MATRKTEKRKAERLNGALDSRHEETRTLKIMDMTVQ